MGTPAVRNLIREDKTHQLQNAIAMGAQFGMQTIDQHLRELVVSRQVSIEDALLRSASPEELRQRLANDRPDIAEVPVVTDWRMG